MRHGMGRLLAGGLVGTGAVAWGLIRPFGSGARRGRRPAVRAPDGRFGFLAVPLRLGGSAVRDRAGVRGQRQARPGGLVHGPGLDPERARLRRVGDADRGPLGVRQPPSPASCPAGTGPCDLRRRGAGDLGGAGRLRDAGPDRGARHRYSSVTSVTLTATANAAVSPAMAAQPAVAATVALPGRPRRARPPARSRRRRRPARRRP